MAHAVRPCSKSINNALNTNFGFTFSGKTSLLWVYTKGVFPTTYLPACFESYVADVELDDCKVELALWDTISHEEWERLRPLSYPDSHIILICYSIDSSETLENVAEKV